MIFHLLTKILLNETIDICIHSLCDDNEYASKILRNDFCNLRNIPSKESFFTFNNKYCKQIDGVAIGFPLSLTLANMFMLGFENKWIQGGLNSS